MTAPQKEQEKLAAAWRQLHALWQTQKNIPLRDLFLQDDSNAASGKTRFQQFSLFLPSEEDGGLLLDFSKTSLTPAIVAALVQLADAAGVAARREAMFAGERINTSESRAVLHTALRASGKKDDLFFIKNKSSFTVCAGEDVIPAVIAAREDMLAYAEAVRGGKETAGDGEPFTDIINIGIGGSDLGPAMAVAALAPDGGDLKIHFVSNMDGAHFADVTARLNPHRTLVLISSKTFTTAETRANAERARGWLRTAFADSTNIDTGGESATESAVQKHLIGITAAPHEARAFGIARTFGYASWVGGRYSLWGAVGLPLALATGRAAFAAFLRGGRDMDAHFRHAPTAQNLPMLLGLVGVWHRNICGYPTRAILPYDQRLHLLPAYLQQLYMESNGKSTRHDGAAVGVATAPVVWGSVGTNAQHAYFQMLHQGTDIVPSEFIIAATPRDADVAQHRQIVANCLAQSAALMHGSSNSTEPHRHFAGNRPSITLMHQALTPYALGRLIALCEHRTFVEGAVWGINAFDQWGVELGKTLARTLDAPLADSNNPLPNNTDSSTRALIARYHRFSLSE